MKIAFAVLSLSVSASLAACTGTSTRRTGEAVVRVEALIAHGQITSVRLDVRPANVQVDLAYNDSDGSFAGTVQLPAGTQVLTATAYAGSSIVGTGTATVNVVENGSVQALIRILDGTGQAADPVHGPVITSISGPTTLLAGAVANLAMTATSPDGASIQYLWTDGGCGTFGSPTTAVTTWSSTTSQTCVITAHVTSGGASDTWSFSIHVLPTPAATGQVSVSGTFVPNPLLTQISISDSSRTYCRINRSAADATCHTPVPFGATGAGVLVGVLYDLGTSVVSPVTVTLTDSCQRPAALMASAAGSAQFTWLPPTTATVCLVTATVEHVGLTDSFSIAVPVRCADDQFEPNNSVSAAAPLGSFTGGTLSFSNLHANDDDWYSVTLPAGQVTIVATGTDSLQLELFSATLQLVASGAQIVLPNASPGPYILHVPPGPSAATCGSTYALTLSAP